MRQLIMVSYISRFEATVDQQTKYYIYRKPNIKYNVDLNLISLIEGKKKKKKKLKKWTIAYIVLNNNPELTTLNTGGDGTSRKYSLSCKKLSGGFM